MSKRKNVSWRVSDDPLSDTINEWLDAQKNIQDSLTNIVLHMIERFGIRNITDYDIQKTLYQEASTLAIKQPIEELPIHDQVPAHESGTKQERETEQTREEPTKSVPEDDMYNEIDINNL